MDPVSALYSYVGEFEDVRGQLCHYMGIEHDYVGNPTSLVDLVFPTGVSVEIMLKLAEFITQYCYSRYNDVIFQEIYDLEPQQCAPPYTPPQRRVYETSESWQFRLSLIKADDLRGGICNFFGLANDKCVALSDIVFPGSIDRAKLEKLYTYLQQEQKQSAENIMMHCHNLLTDNIIDIYDITLGIAAL